MADNGKLLTAAEVADHLGVPVGTLYQWRYLGKGPRSLRVGRHLRYRRVDVEAFEADRLAADSQRYGSRHTA